MEALATKIKAADAFVFVTGEYNWGMQPGLKNLTDHYLEEWFWRPAAIASYSAGRLSGVRSSMMWHGTLSEMGIVVISSTLAVGAIADALDVNGVPIGPQAEGPNSPGGPKPPEPNVLGRRRRIDRIAMIAITRRVPLGSTRGSQSRRHYEIRERGY
jgi:hypothetical protein